MAADRGRLELERRRLGDLEHEGPSALKGLYETLGPQPRYRLTNDGPRHAVRLDQLGLRRQLASGCELPGEDPLLQPDDDPVGQRGGHDPMMSC